MATRVFLYDDATGQWSAAAVLAAGQGGTGLSLPGASGNVLTSNGAGGWTSAAPTSSGGRTFAFFAG